MLKASFTCDGHLTLKKSSTTFYVCFLPNLISDYDAVSDKGWRLGARRHQINYNFPSLSDLPKKYGSYVSKKTLILIFRVCDICFLQKGLKKKLNKSLFCHYSYKKNTKVLGGIQYFFAKGVEMFFWGKNYSRNCLTI